MNIDGVRFKVAGFGSSLPIRRLDNDALASELGVDPEWILTRCGVHSRHIAEAESTRSLGVAAGKIAMGMAPGIRPDIVICNTFTPEYRLCPTAPAIATDLGLINAGAFDLNAACSGGVMGILTSLSLLASGAARAVLLVSTDTTTKYLHESDRQTRILFGDGAAALLMHQCPGGSRLRGIVYGSDGAGTQYFHAPAEEGKRACCHIDQGSKNGEQHAVTMDGRAMFRFAVEQGYHLMSRVSNEGGVTFAEVDKVLVHQANIRIIRCLQERTGIPPERWIINLDRVGNLAGASIPVALVECLSNGCIYPGELVMVVAFGAGLTWAGTLVEW